ncbi:amino acid permease-domain-containing protein [Clohesyomyces aquaticus]|uniref:Amino acid permease-domain-containing protein n=1 Tax=Clohesyomyces aquaticus TaxID=1231657 RepID=A0A1Y1ZJW6_9PLEO|nr:amino acid permease-domain-containing protein [Clohesyomyces aquaticus]
MANQRPLFRKPYYVEHFEHLDRVLSRPQLAGIGISGCVGIGIFVSSGAIVSLTGTLGAPIAYIFAGLVVGCVLYTLSEILACRPLTGALVDAIHQFSGPHAGFAVATMYTLANICSMATLTAQSTELTALMKNHPSKYGNGATAGINLFLILLTTLSQCIGVKLYGKIERVVMWFKLCLFLLVCLLSIIVKTGGICRLLLTFFSRYSSTLFTPCWKPIGFNDTSGNYDLRSSGVADTQFGVCGSGGQFFTFMTAVTIAIFSCFGGEMVAMTSGEAKNAFEDVPTVMSFVYLVPLCLYPIVILMGGLNVHYSDADLAKLFANVSDKPSLSPFVIAVQSVGIQGLAKALNLFFVISAYTAGNTAMYVASRSMFMLAQTYMPKRFADIFGRTNDGHTPLAAIILCSALGLLSLVGISNDKYSQPRITLSEFYTGSMACVYISICFAFLNFKAGLARLERRGIISRNDELYKARLFKSRWQPLPAYIGIVGCAMVVVWSGVPPLYILIAKRSLTSTTNLKSSVALAFDIIGVYIGPILFAGFYFSYKYIFPGSCSVKVCDLPVGLYVLEDLEKIEKEDPRRSSGPAPQSPTAIELPSPPGMMVDNDTPLYEPDIGQDGDLNLEDGGKDDRALVVERLSRRTRRGERGLWRELWSFVVIDD